MSSTHPAFVFFTSDTTMYLHEVRTLKLLLKSCLLLSSSLPQIVTDGIGNNKFKGLWAWTTQSRRLVLEDYRSKILEQRDQLRSRVCMPIPQDWKVISCTSCTITFNKRPNIYPTATVEQSTDSNINQLARLGSQEKKTSLLNPTMEERGKKRGTAYSATTSAEKQEWKKNCIL